MGTSPEFDPVAYKTTTREQWEQAAEAWHRWGPTLEAWLGPATELMLDLAAVAEGVPGSHNPGRRRRPDPRRGTTGRPGRSRAGHRHLADHPGVRQERGRAGRAEQ